MKQREQNRHELEVIFSRETRSKYGHRNIRAPVGGKDRILSRQDLICYRRVYRRWQYGTFKTNDMTRTESKVEL